jgi:hypothetical protein
MDLSKIVSISGRPGLFKIIGQPKNAVIVESLADQKRFPAFGSEKMSSLEEISVFTTGEDLPLKEVFRKLYEKLEAKEAINPRSPDKELEKFFSGIIPDYDPERVYISDLRKILNWYNLLLAHQLLEFPAEEKEEKPDDSGAVKPEAKKEGKSAEKSKKKV